MTVKLHNRIQQEYNTTVIDKIQCKYNTIGNWYSTIYTYTITVISTIQQKYKTTVFDKIWYNANTIQVHSKQYDIDGFEYN